MGVCGADDALRVARAALHFWEEPPISGETGSGAIFFSGCQLRCVYCQNASIALGETGKEISLERLAEIMLELQDQQAMNINMVTASHYAPVIVEAVKLARRQGLNLPIVWNTSSYDSLETLRLLEGTVDVYLPDYKYASPELGYLYSRAKDYPQVALVAIEEMVRQTGEPEADEYLGQPRLTRGVVVRHLLLPGHLENSKEAVQRLYERFGDRIIISLMNQYTPVIKAGSEVAERFPNLLCRPSEEEYEALLDFADDLGIEDYFWQAGGAAEESFIPPFDYTGV